jgi:TIR domain-containing protein
MDHIFISHSHEDSDFAEILHTKLTQAGFTVWRDIAIRGGADWRREIDQGIKEAFALVVVMTPEAKASEYVTYEWAFAWGAGIKVIPVLLKKTELHPRLESLQYFDFTTRTARPWEMLIELLREGKSSMPQSEKLPEAAKVETENRTGNVAHQRMIDALAEKGWEWRSIERLAIIGGVSEDEALDILREDPNVVFAKGKSGKRIAKLKTP